MGNTLTTFRAAGYRAINRQMFVASTATSGSTTTRLELAVSPFKSTISQSQLYKDWWLFRPNAVLAADKIRVVKAYTPATGMFDNDNPWTNAAYTGGVGEAVELIGIGIEPLTDMTKLVNDALLLCPTMTEFTLTPVADATRHALTTTQTWLTKEEWVYEVGTLTTTDVRAETNPYETNPIQADVVKLDGVVYLDHPGRTFGDTTIIYVKVAKPSYYHCRTTSAGTYGERTGLAAEAHEGEPDPDWVGAAIKMLAWESFWGVFSPGDKDRAATEMQRAINEFRALRAFRFRPPARMVKPLRNWGPSYARSSTGMLV
jgi:hypothetical protein